MLFFYLKPIWFIPVCFYYFRLSTFKNLTKKIQDMPEFSAWLQQSTPENCVPRLWEEEKPLSPIGSAMYQLLLIQVYLCCYDTFNSPNSNHLLSFYKIDFGSRVYGTMTSYCLSFHNSILIPLHLSFELLPCQP